MKFFQKRWLSGSLSHVDYKTGKPQMVDVSSKVASCRTAEARAQVLLPKDLVKTVFDGKSASLPLDISTKKGPVFATAVIAGVQAAKNTSNLIPFCHNIVLDSCKIDIVLSKLSTQLDDKYSHCVDIRCVAKCDAKTGVEMEALVGASNAALCVYDMLKAVSHDMVITNIALVSKTGGKSDVSFSAYCNSPSSK